MKMNSSLFSLILVALICCFTVQFLYAEEATSWKFSLGYGLGFKKNLRKNNTYEDMDKDFLLKSLPLVQASVGRVSLGAQGLSVLAVGNRFANISAFINKAGDRYHGNGMTPRKDSFFAGISGKFMKYGLSVARDINGRSKGFITKLNYSEVFILDEKTILQSSLGIDWHDDRYASYYYGVRPHEAIPGRPEYHVKNYFQPGIGVFPIHKFTEKLSTLLGLSLKYLPRDIRRSPTMNDNSIEYGGLIGVSYSL